MVRTIVPLLIVCAAAGCSSSPQPVWPVNPKEDRPDQVTIVTNSPQGMAAFRVRDLPHQPTTVTNPAPSPGKMQAEMGASAFQDYDRAMIEAIQKRWHELRSGVSTNGIGRETGNVVVEFRLHADGRISDLKTISSKVNNSLTYMCEQAVADPEPYPRWPEDMVRKIGVESRVIRFTFSYE